MDKALISSKTVWVNAAVAALVAAFGQFGVNVSGEQVALATLVINTIMRAVTSGSITGIFKKAEA